MCSSHRQSGSPRSRLAATVLALCAAAAPAGAQPPQEPAASEPPASPTTLAERQRLIRDRLSHLEGRLLELSRLLGESEPAKAERLRDALHFAGSHRLRARLEQAAEALRTGDLSAAERQQEQLLDDLDALLGLLTSSLNEAERRRAERERLEALKQALRTLLDEQTQILYRTQQAEQQTGSQRQDRDQAQQAPTGAEPPQDLVPMLRQLEQLQRAAQRRADELRRDLRQPQDAPPAAPHGQDAAPAEPLRSAPGAPQLERASGHMQHAAERLGAAQPAPARQSQEQALGQLQQALDELDQALRQVRREESEETLAALEARVRSMLTRERQVLAGVVTLHEKGATNWTRVEQLRLTESATTQRQVAEDCDATLRILLDEGTTVIVPELLRQLSRDMADVATRLEGSDTSPDTLRELSDIIALLEEMLSAIEQKREADARTDQAPPPADDDGPRPLLPASAELKLLRSAQLRLNERTAALAAPATSAAAAPAPHEAEVGSQMQRLGERQRRLAELARRMNERK